MGKFDILENYTNCLFLSFLNVRPLYTNVPLLC